MAEATHEMTVTIDTSIESADPAVVEALHRYIRHGKRLGIQEGRAAEAEANRERNKRILTKLDEAGAPEGSHATNRIYLFGREVRRFREEAMALLADATPTGDRIGRQEWWARRSELFAEPQQAARAVRPVVDGCSMAPEGATRGVMAEAPDAKASNGSGMADPAP